MATIDLLTEILLWFAVLFSPWAFGTTQPWSTWTMNGVGYSLGLLLAWRLLMSRGRQGARPAAGMVSWPTRLLAVLTLVLLAWCLVSALNGRATYNQALGTYEYHTPIRWLPHSYDTGRSWVALRNYLALACIFWAARSWIMSEVREARAEGLADQRHWLPRRFKRLLLLIALNGGALALEGLLQRGSGTPMLLWMVEPAINNTAQAQFGPYAYRSNGASYLNLAWPAGLAFWWVLRRANRRREHWSPETLHRGLLAIVLVMPLAAIASLSRAAVIITVVEFIGVGVILMLYGWQRHRTLNLPLLAGLVGAVAMGAWFDQAALWERFQQLPGLGHGGRGEIYEHAWKMARDFLWIGSGPNTFAPLYMFYFSTPDQYWAAQVHNDWLETLITFGAVGLGLIVLALVALALQARNSTGIPVRWPVLALMWVGLGGCLLHAMVDFPFQVYSILFLFLVLASLLSCCSIRRGTSRRVARGDGPAGAAEDYPRSGEGAPQA